MKKRSEKLDKRRKDNLVRLASWLASEAEGERFQIIYHNSSG